MLEARVEGRLVQRVKAAGGMVRKLAWIGRRGAPDRVVFLPEGHPFAGLTFVELKRPGLKAEDHQAREHERLQRYGQRVLVIDTLTKVDAFVLEGREP